MAHANHGTLSGSWCWVQLHLREQHGFAADQPSHQPKLPCVAIHSQTLLCSATGGTQPAALAEDLKREEYGVGVNKSQEDMTFGA